MIFWDVLVFFVVLLIVNVLGLNWIWFIVFCIIGLDRFCVFLEVIVFKVFLLIGYLVCLDGK